MTRDDLKELIKECILESGNIIIEDSINEDTEYYLLDEGFDSYFNDKTNLLLNEGYMIENYYRSIDDSLVLNESVFETLKEKVKGLIDKVIGFFKKAGEWFKGLFKKKVEEVAKEAEAVENKANNVSQFKDASKLRSKIEFNIYDFDGREVKDCLSKANNGVISMTNFLANIDTFSAMKSNSPYNPKKYNSVSPQFNEFLSVDFLNMATDRSLSFSEGQDIKVAIQNVKKFVKETNEIGNYAVKEFGLIELKLRKLEKDFNAKIERNNNKMIMNNNSKNTVTDSKSKIGDLESFKQKENSDINKCLSEIGKGLSKTMSIGSTLQRYIAHNTSTLNTVVGQLKNAFKSNKAEDGKAAGKAKHDERARARGEEPSAAV